MIAIHVIGCCEFVGGFVFLGDCYYSCDWVYCVGEWVGVPVVVVG